MKKAIYHIALFGAFFFLIEESTFSQSNFLGKPGLIRIPKPTTNESRDHISFLVSYMPFDYGINNFMNKRAAEVFYTAQLQPLPWVALNIVLTRPIDIARIGVGDRHIDLQFFPLNQSKHGINASVIFSQAFGSSFIDHNSLLVSRKFKFFKIISVETIVGYGFERVFRKPPKNFNYADSGFQWIPKSEFGNFYLSGFFGGLQINFSDKLFISAEYDSKYLNLGGSLLLYKKLGLQISYLNMNAVTGSFSYKIFLDKPRRFNLKYYGKS
jgi:hypothetical protein